MHHKKWRVLFFLTGLTSIFFACKTDKEGTLSGVNTPIFTLLDQSETNVDFNNVLTEGLNTNILMYEYFYNGGGVAAGDLNGDDLIDIYFTSNMASNKLYLNRGAMQFSDVTALSGASGREGPWKTGVTMADVNGDGKLDIYVCYSGQMREESRENQLFINQGNDENGVPQFKEEAREYGLASQAYSNQGFFFDFDRDGDLDMLLLNHNPNSMPVLNEVSTAEILKQGDPLRGVRLFKQTDNLFHDITREAGISSSALTYGLGIGISDINNDGWPDFYISNDYAVPDYLYINNADGTFTDRLAESVGHNSQFSMGNEVADINNDGWPDIVTLDMLPEDNVRQKLLLAPDNYSKFDLNIKSGFHYQYMRNMLQINNGDLKSGLPSFSEVGQIAGISNTDWSWSALLADFDNDGWKDLHITNGYLRDYTNLDFIKYMDDFVKRKGRLKREDVVELIEHMPSSDVSNYVFANKGGFIFANQTNNWGLARPSNSNGAAYGDLDNDGDLDLIVNNINQPAFIYRNETDNSGDGNYLDIKLLGDAPNTQGVGAKVTVFGRRGIQTAEQITTRGYLSSVTPILHFGLGAEPKVDSIAILWPRGKKQVIRDVSSNQLLAVPEQQASPQRQRAASEKALFAEVESPIIHSDGKLGVNDFKRQALLISQLSFVGPVMAKGDVNGDGLEDVFVGGNAGQAASLFLQGRDPKFTKSNTAVFNADSSSVDAAALLFDANGDGYTDIYVASGGYHQFGATDPLLQDRLYLNDGKGNFKKSDNALPALPGSKGTVAAGDVNQDGFADLFVGGRVVPGRYPEAPQSYLLINDGKGRFVDETEKRAPQLQKFGMVTDAVWLDMNKDGRDDLVIVGEWLPIAVFENTQNALVEASDKYFDKPYNGWWNTIEVADVNNDKVPDLLVGNLGTNTQFAVSDQRPAEIFFADYDKNGSVDPIFTYFVQDKSYPSATRDELLDQLSHLRRKFTNYQRYAGATLADIFSSEELEASQKLLATDMTTTLFVGQPDGRYREMPLPLEAQYSPVYTITVFDYDKDGNSDMLLCGNSGYSKLRVGKFDANYGTLLKGNGTGDFVYVPQAKSGFRMKGDVRSVVQLGDLLLFGVCQDKIRAYSIND